MSTAGRGPLSGRKAVRGIARCPRRCRRCGIVRCSASELRRSPGRRRGAVGGRVPGPPARRPAADLDDLCVTATSDLRRRGRGGRSIRGRAGRGHRRVRRGDGDRGAADPAASLVPALRPSTSAIRIRPVSNRNDRRAAHHKGRVNVTTATMVSLPPLPPVSVDHDRSHPSTGGAQAWSGLRQPAPNLATLSLARSPDRTGSPLIVRCSASRHAAETAADRLTTGLS